MRGDWAWYKALFGFKGWASKEILLEVQSQLQRHSLNRHLDRRGTEDIPIPHIGAAGARQTEHWIRVNPLFSLLGCSVELSCTDVLHSMDLGTTWDAIGKFVFSNWSQARVGRKLFSMSCICVCACVLVCVRLSVLRVHVQLCVVSLAGPGLFCAQSRSGRIAELWNKIKLHFKTFRTQSWLQGLTWKMIRVHQKPPKLRAKGAETRHLVPCCLELAMDFHKHQQSAQSFTICGLFELFGLYMTMSVEPFDSAACAKVPSPVLQPLQGLVQGGLPRQLVEADAEDAHGPRDVRGAVGVALLPARVLDLQGREVQECCFVHGARWTGDGFDDSSPYVGHTIARSRVDGWQ